MKKENIKIGLKVKYDNEIVNIKDYFPQIKNTSPSGDVLIEDEEGMTELVNHNELEFIKQDDIKLTKKEKLEAYDKIFGDDEEDINSFLNNYDLKEKS